jgi:cobalt-precorrin-5B (C1)-methyltransferase
MGPPKDNLRSGYTTGACAAAATAGALLALIDRRPVAEVAVRLPGGPVVTFSLHTCTPGETEAVAGGINDARAGPPRGPARPPPAARPTTPT